MCGKFLWVLEDDVGIFVAKFGAFAIHWSTLMHICHPLMHTPIQTAKKFKSIDLKSIIAVSVDSKSCSIWILWNASGFAVPIPNVLLEMFTNQTDLISQCLPLPMQGLMKPFPVSESFFFLSTTQSLERFYLGPNVSSLFPIRSPLKHHNHPVLDFEHSLLLKEHVSHRASAQLLEVPRTATVPLASVSAVSFTD